MPPSLQLLPALSAKSVKEAGKSYYLDPEGRRYPSVTSVLNATKPQAAREALYNWQQRVGVDTAREITQTAGRRGVSTHKYIQRYLLGKSFDYPESVRPYWESLEPILQEIDQVRLVESFVFHSGYNYAGRVDCIASYRGIPCILDWKTADRPKTSIERLYDAPLQLAAYLGAANQIYAGEGLQLDQAVVVVAVPGMTAQVFHLDLLTYWPQWEARVKEYWQRDRLKFF